MTTQLTERIDQLTRSRVPFVQATVVRAQEPSSAHAGDRAIVLSDGTIEGFVGGQCAAGSVRTAALGALESGVGVLLRVLPDSDDAFPQTPGASIVVNPCLSGGALEIYLEPLLPSPSLYLVGDLADRRGGRHAGAHPRLRRRPGGEGARRRRRRRGDLDATAATSRLRSVRRSTPASGSSAWSAATPVARRCWRSST